MGAGLTSPLGPVDTVPRAQKLLGAHGNVATLMSYKNRREE